MTASAGIHSHIPVLLEEALAGLAIKPDGLYVDGTFGRGGHAAGLLQRLGRDGRLLALDKDPQAVQAGLEGLAADRRFMIERGSFSMLKRHVEGRGWLGKVDGVLLDLGMSSPQLDDPARGFSFLKDGPLDMRMDPDSGISAAAWLAQAAEDEIVEVLREYGEERYARRIARAIIAARAHTPITTTRQLAELVSAANPRWERDKHPATRSFQALRIFINHELDELDACLTQCIDVLAPGGRLAVISFHSLEDRLVKRFIRREARGIELPLDIPVTHAELHPRWRAVGKAVRASAAEVAANPRARSAVLRIAERLQ
ncbi:MAG: 16S rRNA (cytosine(1402)-N(4))-methyltransferase RsmH [Gammaproteobacteria bacterium]|nr:16S rRNA (cytosine(1402)-N(4))-methyltransferase RsmH [Gammaproteobacteria bacterium]